MLGARLATPVVGRFRAKWGTTHPKTGFKFIGQNHPTISRPFLDVESSTLPSPGQAFLEFPSHARHWVGRRFAADQDQFQR